MRLVIDGYNLIAANKGALGDIEAQRNELLSMLKAYKRVRKVKITVVFDGMHSGRLTGNKESVAGVETIYSKNGEEADAVIKNMAATFGSGITVVTGDRDVARFVEGKGGVVISSTEFDSLLMAAQYEEMKGAVDFDDDEGNKTDRGKKPSKKDRRKIARLKKL